MEWISVEDKLPEDMKAVVTYSSNKHGRRIQLAWWNSYWHTWLSNTKSVRHITHWMPLPEPPKQ